MHATSRQPTTTGRIARHGIHRERPAGDMYTPRREDTCDRRWVSCFWPVSRPRATRMSSRRSSRTTRFARRPRWRCSGTSVPMRSRTPSTRSNRCSRPSSSPWPRCSSSSPARWTRSRSTAARSCDSYARATTRSCASASRGCWSTARRETYRGSCVSSPTTIRSCGAPRSASSHATARPPGPVWGACSSRAARTCARRRSRSSRRPQNRPVISFPASRPCATTRRPRFAPPRSPHSPACRRIRRRSAAGCWTRSTIPARRAGS